MELFTGIVGTLAGLLVAVLICWLGWRFVVRARAGNREVREARHDPHVGDGTSHTADHDRSRDIPQ